MANASATEVWSGIPTVARGADLAAAGLTVWVCDYTVARLSGRSSTRLLGRAGRPVTPSRVEFAGSAPRSHGELIEGFGAGRIDFGAPVSTMTFGRARQAARRWQRS
jgi:hypothetical protein